MSPDRVRDPAEIFRMMTKLMGDEGCVTIAPKTEQFRPVERSFLDGIRRVPADITAPAGVNPYGAALGKPGRWLFIWIPDD
jgi:hypothetical protein